MSQSHQSRDPSWFSDLAHRASRAYRGIIWVQIASTALVALATAALASGLSNTSVAFVVVLLVVCGAAAIASRVHTITNDINNKVDLIESIKTQVENLDMRLDSIVQNEDDGFNFYTIDDDTDSEKLFEIIENEVKKARKTILVLNSFSEEWPGLGEVGDNPRRSYFQALEHKMHGKMKDGGVNLYVRLIQSKSGHHIASRYHTMYINHFSEMIKASQTYDTDKNDKTVVIRRIRRIYPTSFMIIDDRVVIWQLNELKSVDDNYDEAKDVVRAVIIMRGEGKVIGAFKTWFQTARHSRGGQDLTENDCKPGARIKV